MANSLFIGKVYYRFDELPSTNDYARELLAKSRPPEGTVLQAASQSAGRGQFGSHWESAAGQNLTLSVILYPSWLPLSQQFALSQAVALALYDTVSTCMPLNTAAEQPGTESRDTFVRIKWPNDLYLGNRKTAGILIQNTLSNNHLQTSIIGIGLNVNQIVFHSEIPNPTSLALAFGQTFDQDALAESLFENLEIRYLQLKAGQLEQIRTAYHERLYGRGEERLFALPDGRQLQGLILGVLPDGRLRVQHAEAEMAYEMKAIRLLLP